MRNLLVLFTASVLFSTLETRAAVDVADAKITVVPALAVNAACNGASRIACTRFENAWLACQCERTPLGWAIRSQVRVVPVMYLTNTRYLQHETLHVADFRFYLGKHVQALAEKNFETRYDCEFFAKLAMNAFSRTFQSVGRISSSLRDGKGHATSEDHLIVMKAEIVPQLVNDRLPNLPNDFASAVGDAENRTAKNRDLVRQRR